MKFKNKEIEVVLVGDAKEAYEDLNKTVKEETSKGIISSFDQTLLNAINQKIDFLKSDPEYGTHIAKNKIPKEYIQRYDINNIWKINLPKAFRMLYSLKGEEIRIFALVLDVLNHKDYEKKFGYKKS